MKRPSPGKRRTVTVENLIGLGPERLAEILVGVAETRPDLKRRLRMELAAEQGPAALVAEIDKRLASFETSRGQITWRQRPAFIRDLDALRGLIAERLAPLDAAAAIERLWRFMDAGRQIATRYRERSGELERVFVGAAAALGRLTAEAAPGPVAASLVDSLTRNPSGWKAWLPALLAEARRDLAQDALRFMAERQGAVPGWFTLIRQLADAAGDADAFRATFTAGALETTAVATDVASRYLAAGRTEDAGQLLRAAAPAAKPRRAAAVDADFDWETQWIEYLEQAGRAEEAQAARWASFERTLSADRVRAFVSRLGDFDDVEAESRAFEVVARSADFERGLGFLMEWPALAEAARMIEQRAADVQVAPDAAELWAAKLRRRFPQAAHLLLRRAAALALRRGDFKTCDRLTAEAETINL